MVEVKTRIQKDQSERRERLRKLVEFKGIQRLSLRKYQNRVRRMYDGPAGAVLALGSAISLHEPLVGHVLRSKKFDMARFQNVLDIGSGAGQVLGHLLKEIRPEARVVACDLSHQMLRRARTRVRDDRPVFVAADMMQLPFADETFDCVTCGWVIEHLPDPRPGLSELRRVLRPGGRILLLATEDTFPGMMVSRAWSCRTYNRRELESACAEVGLPWQEQIWFTRMHRFFRMGGILVEAAKEPVANGDSESGKRGTGFVAG
ncbi:MAG: hypothetical protein CMJ48_10345 [Planctomycetaceae bacterium]|nr:hypothetical protein [Planctomycetaceae bacterium]